MTRKTLTTLLFFSLSTIVGSDTKLSIPILNAQDVYSALDTSCVLLAVAPSPSLAPVLSALRLTFAEDAGHVLIGAVDGDAIEQFVWPSGNPLRVHTRFTDGITSKGTRLQWPELLYFMRRVIDRTCLIRPAYTLVNPVAEPVTAPPTVPGLTAFINDQCGTFRHSNGTLNGAGRMRNYILSNLFHVASVSNTTMGVVYSQLINHFNQSHSWDSFTCKNGNDHTQNGIKSRTSCFYEHSELYNGKNMCDYRPKSVVDDIQNVESSASKTKPEGPPKATTAKPAQCDVLIHPPTREEFFHKYLKKSKPFIIKNLTSQWDAFGKWTNDYLRREFGKTKVHIKLTPNGDFEGVERIDLWDGFKTFKIPKIVREQLKFPDLVTVRPAGINMNLSKFMDIITLTSQQNETDRTLSAYLEYSSIPDYMPSLQNDVKEPDFLKKLLTRKHFNMWLSDGHTLGRLHFDQFDNLLCQISGRKQLTLFEPHHNAALYEGHIQQATLTYNPETQRFHRRRLDDSTSMVMSPVNLLQPDFKRFPLFKGVRPVNCTLEEGDALYLPAFWWHEVQSQPSATQKRNLAVNFWYEPFLTRGFPCPECILGVNPFYHHLLYEESL